MFTRKRPMDNMFHDSLSLRDFFKETLPEQIIDIIDPAVLGERQKGERRMNDTCNGGQNGSFKIQECFILILGIGVACSTKIPREMMNINAVAVEFLSIWKNFLITHIDTTQIEFKR